MARIHTELAFEEAIEHSLLHDGGYIKGDNNNYDKRFAIDTDNFFTFLKNSQPENWKKNQTLHRSETENKILFRIDKEMQLRGVLDVIRKGFTDNGVHFDLAYFKPESTFNPETKNQYKQNLLSVTRQLHYSEKNENSVDIVLFLNGIPVATVELKNQFTKQDTKNARRQFIEDRDPREPLFRFKRGALVHFAVDTDEVYLATKLEGKETFFLPFIPNYALGFRLNHNH